MTKKKVIKKDDEITFDVESINRLYLAIGMAITTWAKLEATLFFGYLGILESKNVYAVSASFHAIVSFSGKLDMVDKAMHFSLPSQELLDEWIKIRGRFKRLSRTRSKIAHFPQANEPVDKKNPKKLHAVLKPSIFNMNAVVQNFKKGELKIPTMTAKNIHQASADFAKLDYDLTVFVWKKLPKPPKQFPAIP